ncbi:MAG: hypothetical protein PHC32_02640 [Candidatus Izemoplasmatales bacterium]|nr:hypothetical protein [Candidatus Izemoplasmatales bacterium]MDD3865211.1 hypothetical protein [Candidatus Izemoplasmatales bacterium]
MKSLVIIRRFSIIAAIVFLSIIIIGCQQSTTTISDSSTTSNWLFTSGETDTITSSFTSNLDTTTSIMTTNVTVTTQGIIDIEFDYLDQIQPFNQAIRFEPDGYLANSTWFWHGSPVFSPDGKAMYWSKFNISQSQVEIWYTQKEDGIWSAGKKLIIDGIEGSTNSPVFVPGDDGLYLLNFDGTDFIIYFVTQSSSGWEVPEAINLNIPSGKLLGWNFSIANNKNIYFSLWSLDGSEWSKIYRCIYTDGIYQTPEEIAILNTEPSGSGGPIISPDESFIIFDSIRNSGYGQHDLYISFQTTNGEFSEPINLGAQVNTSGEDASANISADGIYLFFTTTKSGDLGYNPYWIRLSEIDVIKNHSK